MAVCRIALVIPLSGMAAKNDSRHVEPLLKPTASYDSIGCYLHVTCGGNSAQLYLEKLDESKRPLGKCIMFKGSWFTPSEFELHCGKKTKKWRQSIMHLGKPLSEYNLSCPPKQGVKHGSRSVDMRGLVQGHSPHVHRQGPVRSASPALPSVSSQRQSRPLLINSVLSFVKAY